MTKRERDRMKAKLANTPLTVGCFMPPWTDNLSDRAFFALARHIRCEPACDLNAITRDDLLQIRTIGDKTANEIVSVRGAYNNAS